MIFDQTYDIYLPCYYALMTGKTPSCYRTVFRMMEEDLNHKFDPKTIGVDFESGLYNAIKFCFPNARLIGCLFHWKQAIRKKMISMGFRKEVVSYFMLPVKLDLLTVLPKDDMKTINGKAVWFVAEIVYSANGATDIAVENGPNVPVQQWIASDVGRKLMVEFLTYIEK